LFYFIPSLLVALSQRRKGSTYCFHGQLTIFFGVVLARHSWNYSKPTELPHQSIPITKISGNNFDLLLRFRVSIDNYIFFTLSKETELKTIRRTSTSNLKTLCQLNRKSKPERLAFYMEIMHNLKITPVLANQRLVSERLFFLWPS